MASRFITLSPRFLLMCGALILIALSGSYRPGEALAQQLQPPPNALIIDDTDPGFVRSGPEANWQHEVTSTNVFYGNSSYWTLNTISAVENGGRWNLPSLTDTVPIERQVWVFVPARRADTRQAHYTVQHMTGSSDRVVDQNAVSLEWVYLGSYVFGPASDNAVILTDLTGEPYGSRKIAFDAVAFAPPPALPEGATARVYLPVLWGGRGVVSVPTATPLPSPTSTPNPNPTPNPPAGNTTSRYIKTVSTGTHYAMGCAAGKRNEQGALVLAFGQTARVGFGFGTHLYDSFTDASTDQIAEASKAFVRGFWDCSSPGAQVRIGLGTNNYKGETNAAHGAAWGTMVNAVHNWVASSTNPNYSSRITIYGANDIEPSWNSVANTRDWIAGYVSTAQRPYLNFGSCDGCPTRNAPEWKPNNNWSLDDVWFASYGSGKALPLPEIYATSGVNARQWQWLSRYARQQHGDPMAFAGALTQYQACQDRDPVGCHTNAIDNTPPQGWQQLSDELNGDALTAQTLPPPSDITWQNPTSSAAEAQHSGIRRTLVQAGSGVLIDEALPPVSAQQFLGNNAWIGALPNGDRVYVFAGLARDPQLGGDRDQSKGALLVMVTDSASGEFLPKLTAIYDTPRATGMARISSAADGQLWVTTAGGEKYQFDVRAQAWR